MATETFTVTMYRHTCERCEHIWQTLTAAPKSCSKCHSPYWAKPRVRPAPKRSASRAAATSRRRQAAPKDPGRVKALLTSMDGLSTADVHARLLDKTLPLVDVRALASELGMASVSRASRKNLAQQLAPKIVNYRAYWRLGKAAG